MEKLKCEDPVINLILEYRQLTKLKSTYADGLAAYIRECLESVVNQSLRELEIICIDAGSTDGTEEILKNNLP